MPLSVRTRRCFAAAFAVQPYGGAASAVRSEEFFPSPGKGTAVMARAWYNRARGGGPMCIEER